MSTEAIRSPKNNETISPSNKVLTNTSSPLSAAQKSMQSALPVSSRLYYPTVSYVASTLKLQEDRDRSNTVDEDTGKSPKVITPVDPNASFLQTTASAARSSWRNSLEAEEPEIVPIEHTEARRASLRTGPSVESKLHEVTKAVEHARWKPKEEVEAEKAAKEEAELNKLKDVMIGGNKKVTKVSEHILTPTKAMEASKWKKENESDPRESGWKGAGVSKVSSSAPVSPSAQMNISISSNASVSDMDSVVSTESKTMKVKKTSSRLLEPTVGNQYARWRPPEDDSVFKPAPIPKKAPKLSSHLLAPTAKMHLSTYVKPTVEIDPREKGWNDKFHIDKTKSPTSPNYVSVSSSASVMSSGALDTDISDVNSVKSYDTSSTTTSTRRRRVSDASDSLLRPTANNIYARWNPPETTTYTNASKRNSAKISSKAKSSNSITATTMKKTSSLSSTPTTRSRSQSLQDNRSSIGHESADEKRTPIIVKEAIALTQNKVLWEEYKQSIEISPTAIANHPNIVKKSPAKSVITPIAKNNNSSWASNGNGTSNGNGKTANGSQSNLTSNDTAAANLSDNQLMEMNSEYDDSQITVRKDSSESLQSLESPDHEKHGRSKSFRWAHVPEGVSVLEAAKQLELDEETSSQGSQSYNRASEVSSSLLKPTAATENAKWNKPISHSPVKRGSETMGIPELSGEPSVLQEKTLKDLDMFYTKKKTGNPLSTPKKKTSVNTTRESPSSSLIEEDMNMNGETKSRISISTSNSNLSGDDKDIVVIGINSSNLKESPSQITDEY